MKRIISVIFAILLAAVLLVGCGTTVIQADLSPNTQDGYEHVVNSENVIQSAVPNESEDEDIKETSYSAESNLKEEHELITAPNEVDRYEMDTGKNSIEVCYTSGGAGRKDGATPHFTGNYESLKNDIHDLLDITQLTDEALPVYRIISAPRNDGKDIADYDNVIKRLEQEAYDYFKGVGIENDNTLLKNEGFAQNKQDPKFFLANLDLTSTINSALTFFSYITQVENGENATADNVLEIMDKDKYYISAAEYLGITEPVVLSRVSHMYKNADRSVFTIYQAADDPLEIMYNIAFKGIVFSTFGDGQFVGTSQKETAIEYIGDASIRHYEDAVREATLVYGVEEEDILAYDLGYYNEISPGYYIPCYRLIVNTHGRFYSETPDAPEPEMMECIDVLVPAIDLE